MGSSSTRVEPPPILEGPHLGSDTECIVALNDLDDQRDWDEASDDDDIVSDDGTVLVENSQVSQNESVVSETLQEGNATIIKELHDLGRLFEMEGLEEKRCAAILERVKGLKTLRRVLALSGRICVLMEISFLSWNMRGSNSIEKLHSVKRLIRKHKRR